MKCCVHLVSCVLPNLAISRSAYFTVLLKGVSFFFVCLFAQLMPAYGPVAPPHLCCTNKVNCFKTSAATTHLDNEECIFHTHRRHFSFLSYTCKSIFSINKQKESIKHDSDTMHSDTPYKTKHFTLISS